MGKNKEGTSAYRTHTSKYMWTKISIAALGEQIQLKLNPRHLHKHKYMSIVFISFFFLIKFVINYYYSRFIQLTLFWNEWKISMGDLPILCPLFSMYCEQKTNLLLYISIFHSWDRLNWDRYCPY